MALLHSILASYNSALMGSQTQINSWFPLGNSTTVQSLGVAPCEVTDQSQLFQYQGGLIMDANGNCVMGNCSSLDCYPLYLTKCNASDPSQLFSYTAGSFVSQSCGGCLDVYSSTGPMVGIYSCTGAPNQDWTLYSVNSTILSHIHGFNCLSEAFFSDNLRGYIYQGSSPYDSLTFLQNAGDTNVTILYNGLEYFIPAASITLVDADGIELYNTAKVITQDIPTERVYNNVYGPGSLTWQYWSETIPPTDGSMLSSPTPLEQLNITQDETEYMFYMQTLSSIPSGANLSIGGWMANSYSVFIDETLVGNAYNIEHSGGPAGQTITLPSSIAKGSHTLTIVSGSLGINNGINNMQPGSAQEKKGIVGAVTLNGINITGNGWTMRPFLSGELLQVYSPAGESKVTWTQATGTGPQTPLTWFQTSFARPPLNDGVVLIDMNGATRGHFYLNSVDMGRYWTIQQDGTYVQRYYYVPQDMLADTNILVLAEELGVADLSLVSVVSSTMVVPS